MLKKCMAILSLAILIFAQSTNDVNIKLSGFVRFDAEINTRNVSAARETYFVFFPNPEAKDPNGDDKNEVAHLGFYSIASRLTLKATGPNFLGAKTSGTLEGDFFGTSSSYASLVRLRIATITFDWERSSLKLGQDWHPMYSCLTTGTANINAFTTFQPFGRFPQIQFTHKLTNDLKFSATLLSQRDFAHVGLSGYADNSQIRYGIIPNTVVQFDYTANKHLIGAGLDFTSLVPQTQTSSGYKTSTRVNSISPYGYIKLDLAPFTLSAKVIYAQNLTNLLLIGGFGVTKVDPVTAEYTYKPLSTLASWIDFNYKQSENLSLGVALGYTQLQSSSDKFVNVYGRGITTSSKTAIENVLRISPRVVYTENNIKLYGQIEMTSAGYGTYTTNTDFKINNIKSVTNLNLLAGIQYFF